MHAPAGSRRGSRPASRGSGAPTRRSAVSSTPPLQADEPPPLLPSDKKLRMECYGKYQPPAPMLPPVANHRPFISDEQYRIGLEPHWNKSCVLPEPGDYRPWKHTENLVQRSHTEGDHLCSEADRLTREGRYEEALAVLRRARKMFIHGLDSKRAKQLSKPGHALCRRTVAIAARLVEAGNKALAENDHAQCKPLAIEAYRLLCWVASDPYKMPRIVPQTMKDAHKVGVLWVNCSYELANQALEASHNAMLAGDALASAMSLGIARQEYQQLLHEDPLPYRAETEARFAKTSSMGPGNELPQSELLCRHVDQLLVRGEEACAGGNLIGAKTRMAEVNTLLCSVESDQRSPALQEFKARSGQLERNMERAALGAQIGKAGMQLRASLWEDCRKSCQAARPVFHRISKMGAGDQGAAEIEMDTELMAVIDSLENEATVSEQGPAARRRIGKGMGFIDKARSALALTETEVALDCAKRAQVLFEAVLVDYPAVIERQGMRGNIESSMRLAKSIISGEDIAGSSDEAPSPSPQPDEQEEDPVMRTQSH